VTTTTTQYVKGTILRFDPRDNAFGDLKGTRVEVFHRFYLEAAGEVAYRCTALDAPRGHYPNGIIAFADELSHVTDRTELAWKCYRRK
jgi:hypothetical protein